MTPPQRPALSEPVAIFGIPLDPLAMDQVVERILAFRAQFAKDGRPRFLATVNVDFVANSLSVLPGKARHPELLDVLCRADLAVADGMPLVWLSRLVGEGLPARVAGADLIPRLAKESGPRGLRLFFLGGAPQRTARALEVLRKSFPDMLTAGYECPTVPTQDANMEGATDDDYNLTHRINEARPDVLLVAFGNPKQELWFNRNRYRLKVPVTIGIGGTLDLIAGAVPRAPLWMLLAGLEWLWRLAQEPGRLWRRYTVDFFKLAVLSSSFVFFTWMGKLFAGRDKLTEEIKTLRASSAFGPESLRALRTILEREQKEGRSHILDVGRTRTAHGTALGGLIRILRQQADSTHALKLQGMNFPFRFFLLGTYAFASLALSGATDAFKKHTDDLPRRSLFSYEHLAEDMTLITLYGRLDAAFKASLPAAPLPSLLNGRRLALDARHISFADSSGIALLLVLHKIAAQNGRRLHVAGAKGVFRQILALTRLESVFILHHTNEDAVRAARME